jgi:hypothetical protein
MFLAIALFILSPAAFAQTRGCQLPPNFPCPDARIMEFKADVLSIKPGQSAILSWVSENPGGMRIEPGIGAVTARGSARVSPSATTTYKLSVAGGPNGETLTRTLTISVEGNGAANATPSRTSDVPLRLADGRPNLQGVYNSFGPRQPAAAPQPVTLPTRPTLKPGMESYRAVVDSTKVVSDCVVGSVPPSIGPYSFQIIQNSDYVVIHYEYMHLFRTIPLDGTPHQPGISWMGDSIGRWEGDVLVIDTVGFNTESTVGGGGDRHQPFHHSEDLHMVERIRRVDLNTLEIDTTLEDQKVFEGPWRTVARYTYHPEHKKVDEYICNENLKNYDYLVDPSKEIQPK